MLLTDWLHGIVLLALPVCLFLTRRLRCDDPLVLDEQRARTGPGALILGGVAFSLLLLGAFIAAALPFAAVAAMLTIVLHARALADGRMAARDLIALVIDFSSLFVIVFAFSSASRHIITSPGEPWVLPSYALLCVILGATARRLTWERPAPRAARIYLVAYWGLLLVGSTLGAINVTCYGSASQLKAFVATFDEDLEELTDWRAFGRAHAALADQGGGPENEGARDKVRGAIKAGQDVHPTTILGAYEAGFIDEATWAAYRATWHDREREMLLSDPTASYVWTLSQPVHLLALIHDPATTQAQRGVIAARLSHSWPEEPGIGNLGDARQVAMLLEALGRPELVLARRGELHALLRRSWCRASERHQRPGGFSSYDDDCARGYANEEAAFNATWLMRRVGVPEGIDLALFESHLAGELRPPFLIRRPFVLHALDADAASARHLLRTALESRLHAARTPWRHLPFIAWLMPGALMLILIGRAPRVEILLAGDRGAPPAEEA